MSHSFLNSSKILAEYLNGTKKPFNEYMADYVRVRLAGVCGLTLSTTYYITPSSLALSLSIHVMYFFSAFPCNNNNIITSDTERLTNSSEDTQLIRHRTRV